MCTAAGEREDALEHGEHLKNRKRWAPRLLLPLHLPSPTLVALPSTSPG